MNSKTFIIAEAGVNHNGSIELAEKMIDVAAEAGADAVKFQTFRAAELASKHAPKALYQKENTGTVESQYEMLKKLEVTAAMHDRLMGRCKARNIEFLSTPFDMKSLRLLTEHCRLKTIKIPSGEITNAPFLLAVAQTGRDIILSTGMSYLGEVERALGVLAFGYLGMKEKPTVEGFDKAYSSKKGQSFLQKKVKLLHCTTEYPTPEEDVNLRAMDTMKKAFGLEVGYSDHTEGVAVAIAAVARGAKIIEKHFTLDKTMQGPDHKASLEPTELSNMIKSIRQVEMALGNEVKCPTPSEEKNIAVVRKSLVAGDFIKKGDLFTSENLQIKRPGNGISPFRYWEFVNKVSMKDYVEDELIEV